MGTSEAQPSYKMFAGSDIERGLREGDTAQTALGACPRISVSGSWNPGLACPLPAQKGDHM